MNTPLERALPRHISRHHTGNFDVRIKRGGVEYRARVATLERAVAVRDEFLRVAGAAPTSNTGICGISETMHWTHNYSYPAFVVSAAGHHRARFLCSRFGGRRGALRAAAAHRSRLTGVPITDQQIEEALNRV